MTSPVLISVILPVCNGQAYIAEAVDSILQQTFTDFELIVINDGSVDGTLSILQQFQTQDHRVILVSRENKGLVASLNEGIALSRGEWIARMDADDIALPLRFERQLQYLKQTGADICGSHVQFFGTADKRIIQHPQGDDAIKVALLFGTTFAHPTVVMRSALIKGLRYDPAWEKCEDYELWARAAQAGWKMVNVPEVLLLYRQHPSQISSSASSCQQQLTQKIRIKYGKWLFNSYGFSEVWVNEVLNLREPHAAIADMNNVDAAFAALLQYHNGEAQDVILDHALRLYLRAAANCPDIVERWCQLNSLCGKKADHSTKIKLHFLRLLRLRADNPMFNLFKRMYFYLAK